MVFINPTITAFKNSPDQGAGLARDLRVRWALEEVGVPYNVRLVSFKDMKEPAHLELQPFGQIPTYEAGDLVLFETGSIVLHIPPAPPPECHEGLLPMNSEARARTITWMFAAVNTVEPPIVDRDIVKYFEVGKPWQHERFAMVDERIREKLSQLVAWMGKSEWIEGAFSAADIMMVHVLRRLKGSGLLDDYPTLTAYIARAGARPAYQRAFDAQLAVVTETRS